MGRPAVAPAVARSPTYRRPWVRSALWAGPLQRRAYCSKALASDRVQRRRDAFEVALDVAGSLGHGVAAELFSDRFGQDQGDHGLGNDACGRNGTDVRTLVVGLGGFPGAHVDG